MRLAFSVAAAIAFLLYGKPASAQAFPAGLSESVIGKFIEYDERVVRAIRETRENDIPLQSLAPAFARDFALAAVRDVFGSDWGAIKAFADAALSELPFRSEDSLLAGQPEHSIDMDEAEQTLADWLSSTRDFEEMLATARFWDPRQVAVTAASVVLPRIGAEAYAHHSVTSAFVSRQLVRTTWRGSDAIALLEGAWVTVLTYSRTPKGLIWVHDIALYAR